MHPLAKKLLVSRQLRLDEGELVVLGNRNLMIPLDIIYGLKDVIPEDKVYLLGEKAGKEISANLRKMGLKSTKLGSFAHDLLSMSGWGKFSTLKMDKKSVIVHVENSMEARRVACEKGSEKRCYFLAGVLSALWNDSLDSKDLKGNETKCMCTGTKVCEFILKPN